MTLQERLMFKVQNEITIADLEEIYEELGLLGIKKEYEKRILHTIEQTIKEGCEVVEGMKQPMTKYEHTDKKTKEESYSGWGTCRTCERPKHAEDFSYNSALTDTQHALRGIIG